MDTKPRFDVIFLKDAAEFLLSLDVKVRAKIQFNIFKSQRENDIELFKKISNSIWEFRTRYNGMTYRLLAFWDKEKKSMVVATHGFEKKTQKTPSKEIHKAEKIMKMYYNKNN